MTRRKVFTLDGGAGRAISAIPALEKYAKAHPDEDWKIIIGGWDTLYFGNPLLQDRTFSMDVKGLFETVIKDSEIVHPEPYTQWQYYNQQCSLAEAFDKVINQTDDHSDLGKPNMYLCKAEEKGAANTVAALKAKQNKDISIVKDFWKALGSKVHNIEPKLHDMIFARTSHLPHIISYSLMHSLIHKLGDKAFKFSGGSLEDYTRTSSSDPRMWKDVSISNKEEILSAIDDFISSLNFLKDSISKENENEIEDFLRGIKSARDNLIMEDS